MSRRKFSAPRHGSLAYLPRKRFYRHQGKINAFEKDDAKKPVHLTGFLGYKAGCTHVVRDLAKPGSKMDKKEIVENVTIIDCPAMVGVGLVGYVETPKGLRTLTTVWAQHLSEEVRRRFYRRWYASKKKAFTKYSANLAASKKDFDRELQRIKKYCTVVRLICHTQISKVPVGAKTAHIAEIQVNGGNVSQKVDFAVNLLEKEITVGSVFAENDLIDTCAVTKGKGFKGVISRWGVGILPRKTHRGNRKVACIGAWHPARISWTMERAGQQGMHHRTELNKKIFRIGAALNTEAGKTSASTEFDLTKKSINPMGGFVNYGLVKNEFLMIKGSVTGPVRRVVTLRKAIHPQISRSAAEKVALKFIDTSSKQGHGRFQTAEEKVKFYGPRKARKTA